MAGAANAKEAGWAGSLSGVRDDELARRSFRFRPGDLRPDWANQEDAEVVALQFWMASRPLTWSFGYYVDNVAAGLSVPGCWYLNRKTGILQYCTLPGEDLTQAEVIAPETLQLVRVEVHRIPTSSAGRVEPSPDIS